MNVLFGLLTVLQLNKLLENLQTVFEAVKIFPDPQRINGYLVMTEVLNSDGTPHESNGRNPNR